MALHLACRYHQDVAGVFVLSGFLNKDSVVYRVSMVTFISLLVNVCKCIPMPNQSKKLTDLQKFWQN